MTCRAQVSVDNNGLQFQMFRDEALFLFWKSVNYTTDILCSYVFETLQVNLRHQFQKQVVK